MAGKLKPKKKRPTGLKYVASASPVQKLLRKELIDVFEHTAADEILAAYCITVGAPVRRDADLGLPQHGMRPGLADHSAAKRIDIVDTYHRWRAELAGKPQLAVAMAALLQEQDPRHLDASHGWRKGTARLHLIAALRHYAALRGNTPKGADGWKMPVDNPRFGR